MSGYSRRMRPTGCRSRSSAAWRGCRCRSSRCSVPSPIMAKVVTGSPASPSRAHAAFCLALGGRADVEAQSCGPRCRMSVRSPVQRLQMVVQGREHDGLAALVEAAGDQLEAISRLRPWSAARIFSMCVVLPGSCGMRITSRSPVSSAFRRARARQLEAKRSTLGTISCAVGLGRGSARYGRRPAAPCRPRARASPTEPRRSRAGNMSATALELLGRDPMALVEDHQAEALGDPVRVLAVLRQAMDHGDAEAWCRRPRTCRRGSRRLVVRAGRGRSSRPSSHCW